MFSRNYKNIRIIFNINALGKKKNDLDRNIMRLAIL